jgi:hypothetical protein
MGSGGKFTGTNRVQWMDGEFFLVTQSDFKGAMGKGTETAYMGYDSDEEAYTYDSFNSMGEADHAKGTLEGDTWTWLSETRMGAQTMKGRLTLKVVSAKAYNFKFELSADGKTWSTVLEGKDTKKSVAAESPQRTGCRQSPLRFGRFSDGQRSRVAGLDGQVDQPPLTGLGNVGPRRQQPLLRFALDRNVELMKRQRKAFTSSLDVSLFPGPAAKERLMQFVARTFAEITPLMVGKETLRNLLDIALHANLLDVDADLAPSDESHDGDPVAVRDVELQISTIQKERLAVFGVTERNLLRGLF